MGSDRTGIVDECWSCHAGAARPACKSQKNFDEQGVFLREFWWVACIRVVLYSTVLLGGTMRIDRRRAIFQPYINHSFLLHTKRRKWKTPNASSDRIGPIFHIFREIIML